MATGVFLRLGRWLGALALLAALAGAVMAQPAPSGATRWITLRGQAVDLALAPGGDVLALDENGLVWKLSGQDVRAGNVSGWHKQAGLFRRLRAGQDSSFWGIDAKGVLYRLTGDLWRPLAERVRDVAVTPDGVAWLLDAAGRLVRAEDGAPFEPTPPVPAESLVADEHGLPWLRYDDGTVLRFDGLRWQSAALPADGLRRLAIGADGSAFAIGVNGGLLRRELESGRWQPVSLAEAELPPLRHLAVGPDGLPWLISTTGELLAERPVAPVATADDRRPAVFTRLLTWTPAGGGSARQISLGNDGTAFSIATDGSLWRWQGASNWSPIPGRLATIAADSGGRAWGIDESGRVRQLEDGFWRDMPGHASLIAVGPRDSVWSLSGDTINIWNETTRLWQQALRVPFVANWMAVGAASEPWLIDAEGKVHMWRQDRWNPVPGIVATTLAIGPDGTVYATTREQGIYWLDLRAMQWKPATGQALQIAVGPGGAPWIVAPGNQLMASGKFLADRAAQAEATRIAQAAAEKPTLTITAGPLPTLTKPLVFQLLAGDVRVRDIGIGANGAVFAVSGEGSLLCFSNPTKSFVLASSGQSARVAVAANGRPWILGSNGIVAHFEKGAWRSVPEFSAQDVASGPDGRLWAAGIDGESYRYTTASSRFERLPVLRSDAPAKAKRIAGANDGVYWIISAEHQLFRCDKGDCRLQLTGAQDIAVAPDNTVFALDLLGNVQKFNATKKQFEKQNGQGQAIAVGPQGLPWLVTTSGQVQQAGLFFPNSKSVNTADCATQFALAQTPVSAPGAALRAVDDIVTSLPGGSIAILANDSLNGRVPTLADVNVLLESSDGSLRLSGESVVVASNATTGAVLRASYRICPRVVFGACAEATITVTVSGAPNAPTGVSATAGNAQALVSFTAPVSNGGPTITSYTMTSSPGGFSASGEASPLTVTGLTNGSAYTFTVTATNALGTSAASTASSSVTPVAPTVPGAPTNVVISSASATSVNITFTAPTSDGGSGIFAFTATSSPVGITGSNDGPGMTIGGLTTGTLYTFTVTATNAVGTGPASAASNAVTPGVPRAPTNVTATPGGAVGELVVSFTPVDLGGGTLNWHTVNCSPVPPQQGLPVSWGGAVGSNAPITVPGMDPGVSYTCRIYTENSFGALSPNSAASNAAVVP